jgi:hypothetical protein
MGVALSDQRGGWWSSGVGRESEDSEAENDDEDG